MSYTEKVGGTIGKVEMDTVPKKNQITNYVKDAIDASKFYYHESEEFLVTKVYIDSQRGRGNIEGVFIRRPQQEVKDVKPLWPNIITMPVVGEHVVVIEFEKQLFYTSIINTTNSTNENSIPGVVDTYEVGTKLGKGFEKRNIPQIQISEGSIAYEGRFGQSIHFDKNIFEDPKKGTSISPVIKIRATRHHNDSDFAKKGKLGLVREDLDDDDSSIYLTSNGLQGQKFEGKEIKGKNIFMKSDNIYIRGRKDVIIQGKGDISLHAESGQTIKMGDPNALYIPTVDAKALVELMKNIMSFITKTFTAIGNATNPATLVKAAKDIKQALGEDLPAIIDTVENEKYLNNQIQVADPSFKLPENPASKLIAKKKQLENLKENIEKRAEQIESIQDKVDKLKDITEIEGEVEQIVTVAGVRG